MDAGLIGFAFRVSSRVPRLLRSLFGFVSLSLSVASHPEDGVNIYFVVRIQRDPHVLRLIHPDSL